MLDNTEHNMGSLYRQRPAVQMVPIFEALELQQAVGMAPRRQVLQSQGAIAQQSTRVRQQRRAALLEHHEYDVPVFDFGNQREPEEVFATVGSRIGR